MRLLLGRTSIDCRLNRIIYEKGFLSFFSNFFLYLLKRALCSATAAVIVASEGNMALVV